MTIIEKKIINSIIFFALKNPDKKINRLKLMKLLWLADRIHLNKYGRLILKDKYNALPRGPIPSNTYNISKNSQSDYFTVKGFKITAIRSFEEAYFSKSDIEVLEHVWEKYGKSDIDLIRLSHKFPEWVRFEEVLNNPNFPNSYPMSLDDFFNPPIEDVEYDHNIEESNHSKKIFHKHSAILSYLTE
ncbi:MAG: Panacea domain-containing protein [bacterium]